MPALTFLRSRHEVKESVTFQHTVTIPTLNENVISKVSHLKVQPFHFYLLKLFPIFLVEKERKAKGMERVTFQMRIRTKI